MTSPWGSLEGVTLFEKFQVQSLVKEDEDGACFLVQMTGGSQPRSWLRLALTGDTANDDRLQFWERAARLHHPNLVRAWQAGHGERGVTSMVYLLTEPADEDLEQVLQERPLDQLEAREALLSAARALSYLHSRKLVHGGLKSSAILAVGDKVKLSVNTIQPSVETGGALSPADDLRALGDCIHAMFTQRREADPERLSKIPQPFRDIVVGCYGKNADDPWTAERIIGALELPPAAVATVANQPAPVAPAPAPKQQSRISAWMLVPACVLAILIVSLFARKPQPVSSPAPVLPVESIVTSGVTSSLPAALTPSVPPALKPTPAKPTTNSQIWRVISYTYSRAEDAAKMAGEINRKSPYLHAERFVLNDSGPPYLVALGGRMTRSEALRLRERAISSGMPADTFVRNFKK
jgi:serine/threonine protein kinase